MIWHLLIATASSLVSPPPSLDNLQNLNISYCFISQFSGLQVFLCLEDLNSNSSVSSSSALLLCLRLETKINLRD